jgi:multidrug efflux pump
MINVSGGRSVPLEQLAKLSYGIEPPLVWRRHRIPTITVQADTAPGMEAATVVKALSTDVTAFRSSLPAGYDVVAGGTVEESAKSEASIFAVFPLMILPMITILMVQLQSFQRLFLVLATAPLALIGVAAALLISRSPMGFVAILGVFSLTGMVIRNSVILIDQIDNEIAAGLHPWNAVIVATEHCADVSITSALTRMRRMVVGVEVFGWLALRALDLGPLELRRDRADDGLGSTTRSCATQISRRPMRWRRGVIFGARSMAG